MLVAVTGVLVALLSQAPDAGAVQESSAVAPAVAANPDAQPAQVERSLEPVPEGMAADGGIAETPPPEAASTATPPVDGAVNPPPPANPDPNKPSPIVDEEGVTGKIGAQLRLSQGLTSRFPLDDIGTSFAPYPFQTRLRVIPEVHFMGFGVLGEFDAATGAITGIPDDTVVATRVPYPRFMPLELRQIYLEYKWKSGVVRLGQQTQQWGLGILANNGNKDPEAGDFGQQHFGAMSYRALAAFRPAFGMGGAWRAFEVALAADLIVRDNYAAFADGDRVWQGVVALRFNENADKNFGAYVVYRNQKPAGGGISGERSTEVVIIDGAGKWTWSRNEYRSYSLGFEIVGIAGSTTQSRSDTAPDLQVRQFGAAAKGQARFNHTTITLDWGYASGDQNPYDDKIESFRFDRDYKVGLILYDQVLGYQSARSGLRAADPNLTGVPPEGVDLLPTGGSVTGAWYLFPKVKQSITDWFDVYGGPLFSFSTARLVDPFNTRIGGGSPINYLGGSPGSYLGTELDLGVQARWKPVNPLLITLTLEGGVFFAGDAFKNANDQVMGPIGMGRLRLALAL